MNNEEKEQMDQAPAEETQESAEKVQETAAAWDDAAETADVKLDGTDKVELTPEAALQAEVAQLKDQLLRKEADYQNYRKRMAREVSEARRFGLIETVTPFLQVFDVFDMAMKAAEQSDNIAALKQGLEMILAQYGKVLEELGVQKFDAVGAAFDPQLHDAFSYENSDDVADGIIIRQWNCGYKLGDKLLRPARVVVSSGPAKEEKSDPESADAQ
ncbi:MAG: nucleotide exchange factor GrpE [Lentisphaerae bacterium]|nr:nucleotide exchange factor GrpE [Lentisphaerota bacterium]